jgi:hypothetical protein
MASEKQTNANRSNAQRSTGPRTPQGKAVTRMNALKWGLCATGTALLPGESPGEFSDLSDDLQEHYQPEFGLESELVEHLLLLLWRLRRVYRVETGVFAWYLKGAYEGDARTASLAARIGGPMIAGPNDGADEDPAEKDDDELMADYYEARGDAVMELGRAFVQDGETANALTKLTRYETSLLRAIERTRLQLEALQAARRSEPEEEEPPADVEP